MNYIIKKIISMIFTVILISIISFGSFKLIPGDPAISRLGIEATTEQLDHFRKENHLDKPMVTQYVYWAKGIISGDLGDSLRFSMDIKELITARIHLTLTIGVYAILIAILIGIPLGFLNAKYDGTKFGIFLSFISQLGLSIPEFWLGILATIVFGMIFRLFSLTFIPFDVDPLGFLESITLPSLVLAFSRVSVVVRYMKNIILEEESKEYVRTAYSKGLSTNEVYIKHILQNTMIPMITVLGLLTAGVLGGALVIEQVFNLPGVGSLLITGVTARDIPLVQAIVTYIASTIIIINFLIDILYRLVDPRISI